MVQIQVTPGIVVTWVQEAGPGRSSGTIGFSWIRTFWSALVTCTNRETLSESKGEIKLFFSGRPRPGHRCARSGHRMKEDRRRSPSLGRQSKCRSSVLASLSGGAKRRSVSSGRRSRELPERRRRMDVRGTRGVHLSGGDSTHVIPAQTGIHFYFHWQAAN